MEVLNILLFFAHGFMTFHILIIIFAYVYFYILRKAILNIAFPIASASYIVSLFFFHINNIIFGGVISLITLLCTFCLTACKVRFYATQTDFPPIILENFGNRRIIYNESTRMLTIKEKHKEYVHDINVIYKKNQQSAFKTLIPSLFFSCLIFVFLIIQLALHLRQIYLMYILL